MIYRKLMVACLTAHAVTGCCGSDDPPCAQWAEQGKTYTFKLLDASYPPTGTQPSCGDLVPPVSGQDTLAVSVGTLTRKSGGSEDCECIPRNANFHLDVPPHARLPAPSSGSDLYYGAQVELTQGCAGTLTIELNAEPASHGSRPARYWVRRSFQASTSCEQDATGAPLIQCADSWEAQRL